MLFEQFNKKTRAFGRYFNYIEGGKNVSNLSIEKQREISATTETVWNVLTNPEFIKQWLGVTVKTDWSVGSPITFSFTWDGK